MIVWIIIGAAIKLVSLGHPYIGIAILFSVIFFFYGGWLWYKKDRRDALTYFIMMLILYLVVIAVGSWFK